LNGHTLCARSKKDLVWRFRNIAMYRCFHDGDFLSDALKFSPHAAIN
jgi:hypothetical protein